MNTKQPTIISIEGNIGSGKSTLINFLKENYKPINKSVLFLDEPVDEWNSIKDENGNTILEKYYINQHKWAFSFQMMAYITRLKLIRNAILENYDIIITERSIYTDYNVFAKMLYQNNKINNIDYQIYTKWFDEFLNDIPTVKIIYLKTDPIISYNRVIKRDRKGETIPLEYLTTCNNCHNDWIDTIDDVNKLIIDVGNDNRDNTFYTNMLVIINRFIYKFYN